jgi:hypothetical protein
VESPCDTDPEAARVQLELIRRASPAKRPSLALSLSRTVLGLSRRGLARRLQGASEQEAGLRFVELHYGRELAQAVREELARRG